MIRTNKLRAYKTIAHSAVCEHDVNKSRFIANISRTDSEISAVEYTESIKRKYRDARHNCSAYIIGADGRQQKFDDDGEPSGTAGHPMLEVLQKQNIFDVTVVVTRYFGGIKLGAGGLIRAYSHAVSLVLSQAIIVKRIPFEKIVISFGYEFVGNIENYSDKNKIIIVNKEYADKVKYTALFDTIESEKNLAALMDITAGQCKINRQCQVYCDIPIL
ncbi:YigZ family protein [Pectinatus frisingensis]|uniref:YigZ family protein n=1 Tax=Pectinatus frisingensis TaxID=865 RepID=UPI0018C6BEA2|nr:YigZ family protein [Pectinatus frisingensis]